MHPKHFLPLLLCLFLCACGPASENDGSDEETEMAEAAPAMTEKAPAPETTPEPAASPYTIQDGALLGMKVGEPVAGFKAGLRSGVLSTGEGDFPVYYIDGAEGTELGYLMLDDEETTIVDITVTSPDVATAGGISVGMTYADLQKALGEFDVFGSEIEGYTHAEKEGYWYRLDAGNWSEEVDPSTLKPDTRVLSIGLPR